MTDETPEPRTWLGSWSRERVLPTFARPEQLVDAAAALPVALDRIERLLAAGVVDGYRHPVLGEDRAARMRVGSGIWRGDGADEWAALRAETAASASAWSRASTSPSEARRPPAGPADPVATWLVADVTAATSAAAGDRHRAAAWATERDAAAEPALDAWRAQAARLEAFAARARDAAKPLTPQPKVGPSWR